MNREFLSSSASICATNSRFFSVKSSNTFCRSAKSRAEFALRNVRAHANAKRKREDTHKDIVSAVKKIKTHSNAHSNDDKREKTEKKKNQKIQKKRRRPRRTHPIVKQFSNFSKASLKRSNSLAKIFLLLIFSSTDAAPPLPLLEVVEQQHSSNASEAF